MAPEKVTPGQLINHRYRIEREYSSSSSGLMFLGTDLRDGESRVLIRFLPLPSLEDKHLTSLRQRFSILGRIRHPGLARFLDLGIAGADLGPFLVSEYAEGDDLFTASGGWRVEQVIEAVVRLCRILQHIHSERIIHGSLKASNVICTCSGGEPGGIRLLDYGFSNSVQTDIHGLDASELAYRAPEVLLGNPHTVHSDLYSLGVLAYQLLVRKLPFEQDDQGYIVQKHLQGRPDMRAVECLDSGFGLAQVLRDLLEKDPARRPSSAAEVIRLLSAATGRDLTSDVRIPSESCFALGQFVGREREMSFLQEKATAARESRRGRTIFLLGEAGAGKSRCMEEFRIWALLHGWHIVEGRCSAQDNRSYNPYRQALDSTRQQTASAGRAASRDVFETIGEPGIGEAGVHEMLSDSAAGQFRDLLAREILSRLTQAPTLLFLHDYHWADEATTTVLEYLTSDISTHPVLICVSVRPGEAEKSPVSRLMEQCVRRLRSDMLTLSELSEASVEDLVGSMTGDTALGKRIGSWIHRSSGGNPFFAEEILKHLVDQGLMRRDLDGWSFDPEGFQKIEVPAGVAVVLRHRLARLSLPARELIQWLAVFNRTVPTDLLQIAASFSDSEMIGSLEELLSSQMIHVVPGEADNCIEFHHALIGEVVRHNLSKSQLKGFHRKIGETIEERLGPDNPCLELALHYTEGNYPEKAIPFARKAAAAYRSEFAYSSALKYYEFILRHKSMLSHENACEVAIEAAEVSCAQGKAKEAIKILLPLRTGNEKLIGRETRIRVLMQLANAYQHLGDMQNLEISARKGLALLRGNKSVGANASKALFLKILSFNSASGSRNKSALILLRKALACLDLPDSILAGIIFASISAVQWIAGNLLEAVAAGEQSIEILKSTKTRHLQATAYSLTANALHSLGRFRLALEKHRQATTLSCETRSPIAGAQAVGNMAECLCRMGCIREAATFADQAIKLAYESDNEGIRNGTETIWAEIKISQGEYQPALRILDKLIKDQKDSNPIYLKAHLLFLSAWAALELSDYGSTISFIKRLSQISGKVATYEHKLGEILCARAFLYQGEPFKALALLKDLDRAFSKSHWLYHRCSAKTWLAEVYIEMGEWGPARKSAIDALRLSMAMPCMQLEGFSRFFLARTERNQYEVNRSLGSPEKQTAQDLKQSLFKARDQLCIALRLAQSSDCGELLWRVYAELSRVNEFLMDHEASIASAHKAIHFLNLSDQILAISPFKSGSPSRDRRQVREECEERARRLWQSAKNRSMNVELIEEEHLRKLFRVSGYINSIRDLDQLVEIIPEQLLRVTVMARAFLFLSKDGKGNLRQAGMAKAKDASDGKMPSMNLIEEVFSSERPFISVDCARDDRLSNYLQGFARIPGAAYCAPLLARGKVLGILYADCILPVENLGESAINLFAAFCNLAAVALDNAIAHQYLVKEKTELEEDLRQAREGYPEIVGKSGVMNGLRERISLVAASPLDVLIVGESGTGKELVARALHRTGKRSAGVFIPLDCGALSENLIESELFGYRKGAFTGAIESRPGLLEMANGGIVFLDEISNLSLKLQGKLLRVLQEREVRRIGETQNKSIDVRVLAATNKSLLAEARRGRFRKDLYYRLNAMQIQLAPLREHMEDIPSLLDWFLRKTAQIEDGKIKAFSSDALKLLCTYRFPGNVRELRNIVLNSYYSCPGSLMQIEHLPLELRENIADPAPDARECTGRSLYDRIRRGMGNFNNLVKEPFQKRNFGRNVVRNVIRRALIDAEGRYRDAFRLLRVPSNQYSSMMIFLKRHGCYLDFKDFRQEGGSDT